MGGGEDMSAGQFTLLAYSQQRLSPEESSGTEAFLGTDSFFSLRSRQDSFCQEHGSRETSFPPFRGSGTL